MRPLRLLLSVSFVLLTLFLTFYSLLYSHLPKDAATSSRQTRKSGLRALFSFHAPAALFPPSAIISLTDDNSTFFLSRPADFGPPLPSDGQSGQLWIGSGFGEDTLAKGGLGSQAEGELGCSDIPGWTDGQKQFTNDASGDSRGAAKDSTMDGGSSQHNKVRTDDKSTSGPLRQVNSPAPTEDDGTDNHLHYPLSGVPLYKGQRSGRKQQASKEDDQLEHADIQALQESAEIAGNVVLLSRGGCGFLEKAKWVQRRGGVALIVGDNTRGGPLLTMYAHGDTSNITIPSLFTSRTTAHLLSSLVPAGKANVEPLKSGEKPSKTKGNIKGGSKIKQAHNRPTFTPVSPSSKKPGPASIKASAASKSPDSQTSNKEVGWLRKLASSIGLIGKADKVNGESSRPPSSGDWVISDNWDDEPVAGPEADIQGSSNKAKGQLKANGKQKDVGNDSPDNGFVIGVQDWRDPDMIELATTSGTQTTATKSQTTKTSSTAIASAGLNSGGHDGDRLLTGGSITPGSGVYNQDEVEPGSAGHRAVAKPAIHGDDDRKIANNEGWLSRLFGSGDPDKDTSIENGKASIEHKAKAGPQFVKEKDFEGFLDIPAEHEGLWVTMTPASMSTTPFFDTLLVLVVSPLVTLTVVYALLLLRSRIRRRRWRAPKSVVEQLPVRTYHTMSCSSSSTSSQTPSPNASSPTSPLLRSNSRLGLSRTRPRSRTTSTISEQASTSLDKAATKASLKQHEQLRQPRKYNGKQIECVVCLEEYVDGQSQVMSLPCGHEFHAECITPWLTTRRRTCPICKGDVVRSMNDSDSRATSSNSQRRRYRDDPDSVELQAEAAETRNESPSSAIPIPRSSDDDLERGDDMAQTLVNDEQAAYTPRRGWRELASRSLSVLSGSSDRSWRQTSEDRSR